MKKTDIAIVLGSDSDLEIMSQAAKVLEEFEVSYEIIISSAHRSPDLTIKNIQQFKEKGIRIVIAGAGLAAHLAGTIAAHFPLPVIGVPIKTDALAGADALYSTVQMPPGIPVATVAINGAKNAGLLAVQILATSDKKLEEKIVEYKKKLSDGVKKKSEILKETGWKEYLKVLS